MPSKKLPEDEQSTNFLCETEHVDGTVHALNRKTRLDWLKNENYGDSDDDNDSETVCRILSNARCLSEGIDVPALDAVIFYKPRKSHIDVVQARRSRHAQGTGKTIRVRHIARCYPRRSRPRSSVE